MQQATIPISNTTAQIFLEDVANRLQQQQRYLERLEGGTPHPDVTCSTTNRNKTSTLIDTNTPLNSFQLKHLQHLLYIHKDTERCCRRLLPTATSSSSTGIVLQRWSESDQRIVAQTLEQVRDRHANTIQRLVEIVDDGPSWLERYVTGNILQGRCGIQLLCDHYVKMYHQKGHQEKKINLNKHPSLSTITNNSSNDNDTGGRCIQRGAIYKDCDIFEILQEAITEATHICEVHFLMAPEVRVKTTVTVNPTTSLPSPSLSSSLLSATRPPPLPVTPPSLPPVTVVRSWINHVLVEVLKNAMHATLQQQVVHHPTKRTLLPVESPPPPPITVEVVFDTQKIIIDVIDQGVGIPWNHRSNHDSGDIDDDSGCSTVAESLFRLGHSTRGERWDRLREQQSYAAVRSPMSSLGVGLPISRILLQHFGGALMLLPAPKGSDWVGGDGCRARIILPMDDNILEPEIAKL